VLVAERDPAALAEATHRLLGDPALARRLASAAQADVAARFAPDRIARVFDGVYQRAAGRGRGT
jgi:glycosyltransferase involved in cell wall biosynthesis